MPVSIDIGSKHIKVVQGSARKDGVSVSSTHNIKIPQEVTMGAPSTQLAALSNLLRPLFVREKGSKTKQQADKGQPCNVTLSDDRFLVRNVTIPKGNANEIKAMALQELIATYNVDPDSIVEATVVSTQEDGKLLVRAAAADRPLTEGYYKLIEDIKLQPRSLNFHSNAITKLMRPNPAINGQGVGGSNIMLMDCGMFTITCHVYSGSNHVTSRFLPVGFSDLYHHLSRRSPIGDSGDKTVVYTPTFVESSNEYRNMPSVVTNQIEAFIRRVAEELGKFMRTMNLSGSASGTIERLYLFGGNSKIEGFDHRLANLVNIRAEVINSFSNVEFKPGCENIVYHLNAAAALMNQ